MNFQRSIPSRRSSQILGSLPYICFRKFLPSTSSDKICDSSFACIKASFIDHSGGSPAHGEGLRSRPARNDHRVPATAQERSLALELKRGAQAYSSRSGHPSPPKSRLALPAAHRATAAARGGGSRRRSQRSTRCLDLYRFAVLAIGAHRVASPSSPMLPLQRLRIAAVEVVAVQLGERPPAVP